MFQVVSAPSPSPPQSLPQGDILTFLRNIPIRGFELIYQYPHENLVRVGWLVTSNARHSQARKLHMLSHDPAPHWHEELSLHPCVP